MSAPSISGLSVELLLRVIDVKYGRFTVFYFNLYVLRLGIRQFGIARNLFFFFQTTDHL